MCACYGMPGMGVCVDMPQRGCGGMHGEPMAVQEGGRVLCGAGDRVGRPGRAAQGSMLSTLLTAYATKPGKPFATLRLFDR